MLERAGRLALWSGILILSLAAVLPFLRSPAAVASSDHAGQSGRSSAALVDTTSTSTASTTTTTGTGSTTTSTSTPTTTTTTTATSTTTTTAASGQTLLNIAGTGAQTTTNFMAPSAWTVDWTYSNCTGGQGTFNFSIYTSANVLTSLAGPNQTGTGTSGTESYQEAGTFYMVVNSTCSWTITALAASSTTTTTTAAATTTTTPPTTATTVGSTTGTTTGATPVSSSQLAFTGSGAQQILVIVGVVLMAFGCAARWTLRRRRRMS